MWWEVKVRKLTPMYSDVQCTHVQLTVYDEKSFIQIEKIFEEIIGEDHLVTRIGED